MAVLELAFDGGPGPISEAEVLADLPARQARPLRAGFALLAEVAKLERAPNAAERMYRLGEVSTRAKTLLPELWMMVRQCQMSTAAARRAAQLSQHLAWRLHVAYKRAAVDLSREAGRFFNRRPALRAVAAALLSAWQMLCLYVRTYTPVPPGFWHDCHRMFAYVLRQGWTGRRVARGEVRLGVLYRRILLLGMSAANRLELPRIELLISFIVREADKVELVQFDEALEGHGAFVFRADRDDPALFVEQAQMDELDGGWWMLDLAHITRAMRERSARNRADETVTLHEVQLLTRLQREWVSPPRRRHARQREARMDVELLSGLPVCWDVLRQTNGKPSPSAWGVPLEAGEGEPQDIAPVRMSVSNSSASGMQLEGDLPPLPLHAGDVVLVREDGGDWRLGLVRWVSFPGDVLIIRLGVEMIGQAPEAVMVMPLISHPFARYRMGLRLREGRVLLLPGRHYQPQREFHIADGYGLYSVRSRRLLSQAAYHQVFFIRQGDALPLPQAAAIK